MYEEILITRTSIGRKQCNRKIGTVIMRVQGKNHARVTMRILWKKKGRYKTLPNTNNSIYVEVLKTTNHLSGPELKESDTKANMVLGLQWCSSKLISPIQDR